MQFSVTPWDVEGEVDYEKLVKEFGTQRIDDKLLQRIQKHTKELHFMLRRGVFFCHRDMNWLLDEYEKGNRFFLYTGRASSNLRQGVHIGHLVPWVFTKWLQDKFDAELWFQFPDEEKFFFKEELTLEDTGKATYEDALDVIALGFDAKKTHFLIDTKHASLMYKEACKVAKKITFSTAKAAFGFTNETNIGSIFYTAMQAVPAFLPSILKGKKMPCLIPLAVDQDPHFRVARDVISKLGYYNPAVIHSRFIPGLKEGGKMSASDPNSTIFTKDAPEIVAMKIRKYAFSGGRATVEEHRKKGGNPEIDTSFNYLRMLFEPDDKKLEKVRQDYKSGALLSGEIKEILIEKVNGFMKEHQKKREMARKQFDRFVYKD